MKNNYLHFIILFLSTFTFAQGTLDLEIFSSGLQSPVDIKHAGDDRLFVLEQDGRIQIIQADGTVNTTAFLDINTLTNGGGEQGLLGLAFAPDYATSGTFYLNYTNTNGNTVIARYQVNATNPDLANPNSAEILLSIDQPFSNHNGGHIAFGADGYLYIGMGDGGSGGDPLGAGQDLTTLLGKMLRIDVSSSGGYTIPTDNPFVSDNDATTLPEIWAYGVRNPWKFTFDRDTGDLWIADVGQNEFEEINAVAGTEAGVNYGWRCYEGDTDYNTNGCGSANDMTFPVAVYSHTADGAFKCSVTGGYVYRGSDYPNFQGRYFFGDYCSGEIGILTETNGTWNTELLSPVAGENWTTFGEDSQGELYLAGIFSGNIYKLTDSTLSVEDYYASSFSMYPNPAKEALTIAFDPTVFVAKECLIYSITGQQVCAFSHDTSQQRMRMQLPPLAPGMYVMKFIDAKQQSAFKKLWVD